MSNQSPLLDALNALHHYRLVAVCALVAGLITTIWTVRILPNVFRSTTVIMVEAQGLPQSYVKSTVSTQIEKKLDGISQEVFSRTRLEKIANELSLFPELRAAGLASDRIVDRMRDRISIKVFPHDRAFQISFDARNPETARDVTSRLAQVYIDENLALREAQVSGTTAFLEKELGTVKHDLEQQEGAIHQFKQEHMGELPEQREANMRTLEAVQVQLQTISVSLSAAMERKLLLDRQVAEVRAAASAGAGGSTTPSTPAARLQQLEAQLVELRSRYTEEHPDVVRTRAQIERLRTALRGTGTDGGQPAPEAAVPPALRNALDQTDMEIARHKREQEQAHDAIATYQARIDMAFQREQDLLKLTRDYDVTLRKYQALLDKKIEAQLSQNLEERQQGEYFRVIDPPSLPQVPIAPKRLLLTLAGAAASVVLAIALPILLWQLNTSFHLPDEVALSLIPVLAIIPELPTPDVARRRRLYRLRVVAVSALALSLALGTGWVYARLLY
jgi:polysaccharide chain length determinant protein (PEP-CTERM system associated)